MNHRRGAFAVAAVIVAMVSLTCATEPERPTLSEATDEIALNYDYFDTDGYAFFTGGCLSYAAAGYSCNQTAAWPDVGFLGGDYCGGATLHERYATNSITGFGAACAANACCSGYSEWPVDCNTECLAQYSQNMSIALSFGGTCAADANVTCPDLSHPGKCACNFYSFMDSDGGYAPLVAGAWGKFESATCGAPMATYRADHCSGNTLVEQVAPGCSTTLPTEVSISCESACPIQAVGTCVAKNITFNGTTIASAQCECTGSSLDEQDLGDKPFEAGCMGSFANATCAGAASATWDHCIDPWRLIEVYRPGGGAGCTSGTFATARTYNCDTECKTLNTPTWSGRCDAEPKDCFGTMRTMGKCVCVPPPPPGSDAGVDGPGPGLDSGFYDAPTGPDAGVGDASPWG